ncbi:MAG: ZIP family metal transporter [Rhodosalinus sp.]
MDGAAPLWLALLFAGGAGLAMPLGALVALVERIDDPLIALQWRHGVVAFGGGALLSAVALVLVPDGSEALPAALAVLFLLFGGLICFAVDRWVEANGGAGAQLMAMLLDYLPEAAALGALFAVDFGTAMLLAGLIFLQNLPEGYAAFNEIEEARQQPPRRVVALFAALAAVGPGAAALGLFVLADLPGVLGAIMLTAAGGILYLVFQDIAPQARTPGHWLPPLGAVAGFALGLGGHLVIA